MFRRLLGRSLAAFVLAAATLRGASAAITPEARVVVDRYVAAVGGRAAVDAVRSSHSKGRISALGLTGTIETWSVAPDRYATTTQLGPFTILEGFDGTTGWRTDPSSRKPVKLDGKDLEDERASVWFENAGWLDADQAGGKIALAGTETDSLGTYSVLEITPPVGRPRRFFMNQKTGLLDRVIGKRDQLESVTTLADYRPVAGGLKVPFLQHQAVVGMPMNTLTLTVDAVQLNESVEDARFRFPEEAPAATGVRWLGAGGPARIPFRYSGKHVWLRASVNGGPPADFLYDTGASITVIDSAWAAGHGLRTEGQLQGAGAGSTGHAAFGRLDSLRIDGADGGGIALADTRVAVLSLNPFLAPFFWRDCAGVVGYDVISRFVDEIDFDRQVITLHDPKTFHYAGAGTSLPFTLAGTVPVVTVKLDGQYEGGVRIDVGSSSTVDLHAPFVKKHGLEAKYKGGLEVVGGGFGGTFTSRLVRMKSLALGPFTIDRPMVSFSRATSGAFASEDYAGNMGNQVLQRFKVTLDYDRRVVWLERGAHYAEPDKFSRAGVQLARFGDEIQAMQVLPHSPAEKAGLRQGDRVVTIEGKPVLSYTADEVTALLEADPGKKVTLEVERDGKRQTVAIKLAEIL